MSLKLNIIILLIYGVLLISGGYLYVEHSLDKIRMDYNSKYSNNLNRIEIFESDMKYILR